MLLALTVSLAAAIVLFGASRRRLLMVVGGTIQMEARRFGWSLFVSDEHRHGDGVLQQAAGRVLVMEAVKGVAVHVIFRGEALSQVSLHAVRAGVAVLRPARGWQHVHLTLEEAHVSKHVTLAFGPYVCAVTHVAQRGADHIT